ncbi:hypothetical protein RD055328_12430 [Companilactobacillus sp. RD055328]|uniref:DegV family protein n=1 Tax=Companilactobacillus sp. RD055328 TaxID=2916634 RepID=UPI001FC7CEDD|nr:DegV family protein [Companilactobacillus sp. RD055328]GKQ43320.1 hypothetical protein RD055328_12430 [Companilactobacillus sp. RD055328]
MTIQLVTDSTAQLTAEEIKKYNIHIIPLVINNQGESYRDGIEITKEEFLDKLKNDPEFSPTTSQPAVGDFVELYDEIGKNGDQILSIHLTNLLSGTVEGAFSAAHQSDADVTVVDSKLMDRALGEQLILAGELIAAGNDLSSILDQLEEARKQKETYIFFESLDALQRGGRISKVSGMMSKLLKIKVLIKLEDDELKLVAKGLGQKFMKKTVSELLTKLENEKLDTFNLIHVGVEDEKLSSITTPLISAHQKTEFNTSITSPVVMAHVGLGTFAFIYSKSK